MTTRILGQRTRFYSPEVNRYRLAMATVATFVRRVTRVQPFPGAGGLCHAAWYQQGQRLGGLRAHPFSHFSTAFMGASSSQERQTRPSFPLELGLQAGVCLGTSSTTKHQGWLCLNLGRVLIEVWGARSSCIVDFFKRQRLNHGGGSLLGSQLRSSRPAWVT